MYKKNLQQLKQQILNRVKQLELLLIIDDDIDNKQKHLSSAEVSDQITQKHKQELGDLNKSLIRLDTEYAGICEFCGYDIPFARLQAVPMTVLCISCAERLAK